MYSCTIESHFCYFSKGVQKKINNKIVFLLLFFIPMYICLFFFYTLESVNHNHHQTPPRLTRPKHQITTFHHVTTIIDHPSHCHTNNNIVRPKWYLIPTDLHATTPRCHCTNTTPPCNREDACRGTDGSSDLGAEMVWCWWVGVTGKGKEKREGGELRG